MAPRHPSESRMCIVTIGMMCSRCMRLLGKPKRILLIRCMSFTAPYPCLFGNANPLLLHSIPDEMRHAHVARLTLQAVNRDYHALAREIERRRLHEGGEDAVHVAIPDHVRETVFGHGWGMRMLRNGTVAKTL